MWKGGTCIVLKATYNSSLQLPLSKIFQFLPILNEIREKKIAGLSGFPEWSSECVSADPLRMVSQQIRNVLLPNKCGIKETTDIIAAKKHISALWLCVLNQPFFTVFQYNALWQQTNNTYACTRVNAFAQKNRFCCLAAGCWCRPNTQRASQDAWSSMMTETGSTPITVYSTTRRVDSFKSAYTMERRYTDGQRQRRPVLPGKANSFFIHF